jgi:hypothetical protein
VQRGVSHEPYVPGRPAKSQIVRKKNRLYIHLSRRRGNGDSTTFKRTWQSFPISGFEVRLPQPLTQGLHRYSPRLAVFVQWQLSPHRFGYIFGCRQSPKSPTRRPPASGRTLNRTRNLLFRRGTLLVYACVRSKDIVDCALSPSLVRWRYVLVQLSGSHPSEVTRAPMGS